MGRAGRFPPLGAGIEWRPMKWKPGGRSADVEDRRGQGGGLGGGGMSFPIPMGRMGGGGIGTIIVLVVIYLVFIRGGGGSGGFYVPGPSSAFPQVPQTGTGSVSVPPGARTRRRRSSSSSSSPSLRLSYWIRSFSPPPRRPARPGGPPGGRRSRGCSPVRTSIAPLDCPLDNQACSSRALHRELVGVPGVLLGLLPNALLDPELLLHMVPEFVCDE